MREIKLPVKINDSGLVSYVADADGRIVPLAAIVAAINENADLRSKLAAVEGERDEAYRCLRRCAVTASNLTSDPDSVSTKDGKKIESAMANPLNADELVNGRICDLECQVAQLTELRAACEGLRHTLRAARAPIFAQARYGDVADRDAWNQLLGMIDDALTSTGAR